MEDRKEEYGGDQQLCRHYAIKIHHYYIGCEETKSVEISRMNLVHSLLIDVDRYEYL